MKKTANRSNGQNRETKYLLTESFHQLWEHSPDADAEEYGGWESISSPNSLKLAKAIRTCALCIMLAKQQQFLICWMRSFFLQIYGLWFTDPHLGILRRRGARRKPLFCSLFVPWCAVVNALRSSCHTIMIVGKCEQTHHPSYG